MIKEDFSVTYDKKMTFSTLCPKIAFIDLVMYMVVESIKEVFEEVRVQIIANPRTKHVSRIRRELDQLGFYSNVSSPDQSWIDERKKWPNLYKLPYFRFMKDAIEVARFSGVNHIDHFLRVWCEYKGKDTNE